MYYTAWITLAALALCLWTTINVGKARGKFKIPPPQISGPDEFLRVRGVHANTVEQFVMFLPALWLCAYCLSDRLAALAGMVWVMGRVVYALGYYQSVDKRGTGFIIGLVALFSLMLGTVVGLIIGKIGF